MTDERDLSGRRYIVTGANTGIGKETVRALAHRGASLTLACRSEAKTQPVIEELRRATGNDGLDFVALDLGDFASVGACAERLLGQGGKVDGLINNAGVGGLRGSTKEGFELAFGTNHLGHFLLTLRLLPLLEAAGHARVVNVSSAVHFQARKIDWEALRRPTASLTALPEYAVSKLANVLFTKELTRRSTGGTITAYALHPGLVASDIWGRRLPRPAVWAARPFMKSTAEGARTSVFCATSPAVVAESGRYYTGLKERQPSPLADDAALASELWERSEAWTKI